MRLFPVIGLLAIVAFSAISLAAPAPALGTALCEDEPAEGNCFIPYPKETVLSGEAKNVVFETSIDTVTCEKSTVKGQTLEEPTGSKVALKGQVSELAFSGCKGKALGSCTVESVHLSYSTSLQWSEKNSGKMKVENSGKGTPGVKVACGALVCTFTAEPALEVAGGNPGKVAVAKTLLIKVEGSFLCPKEALWSASYSLSQPKGGKAFVAATDLGPTVLCMNPSNPCAILEWYGSVVPIKAMLVQPGGATFKWNGAVQNTCNAGVIKGTTTKLGVVLLGELTEMTFDNCTCANTDAVRLPWKMDIYPVVGGVNGTMTFSNLTNGAPVLEMTGCGGVSCNFVAPTDIVMSFEGGNPAWLKFSGTHLPELSGGCGELEAVTGKYMIETPKPVWVEFGG